MTDPTERFSDRVEAYVHSRPSYPIEVISTLRNECGLTADSVIADVGSGTGLLSVLFLQNGSFVYAVEPNAQMRRAGEVLLGENPLFESVNGTAEATGLSDRSVEFVVAGQAFHWFDGKLARREFERILTPGGWVALAWNERDLGASSFMRTYEEFLREFGTDYDQVDHKIDTQALRREFYAGSRMKSRAFPNRQVFDHSRLEGRLRSTSYVPGPAHPDFEPMIEELKRLFQRHASDGMVTFEYITRLYFGQLG